MLCSICPESVLYVTVPPTLLEGLQSTDGVQGTDMHLSCKADGFPAPAFRFYKVHAVEKSKESY